LPRLPQDEWLSGLALPNTRKEITPGTLTAPQQRLTSTRQGHHQAPCVKLNHNKQQQQQ
jgi:hypothetical protein